MAEGSRGIDEALQITPAQAARKAQEVRFLPEPPPQLRWMTLISVDDHVVEPPETFSGRVARRYQEEAPRVVELHDGSQAWRWNGEFLPNVGLNAFVGRDWGGIAERKEPARFDEMRRGAWDVHARVGDMELDGIWSSLCFPSFLPGFAGQRLTLGLHDADLAFAMMQAYNSWHLESWCGQYPDRFIPNQIPWLRDPFRAAEEIRRNAALGFRAVSFSEAPHLLGLPSIHSRYWDPFLGACEETGTVVCLHVGSSGTMPSTSPDAPVLATAALFFVPAIFTACEWIASEIPLRFPSIKICLSEGGIGWVPGLMDRFDHLNARHRRRDYGWPSESISPVDIMRRNFWYCAVDDPSGIAFRDRIGMDRIMIESDYPHSDSSWPSTQDLLSRHMKDVPKVEQEAMCWKNACAVFRLPEPRELPSNSSPIS